jgi:hypothetical protein
MTPPLCQTLKSLWQLRGNPRQTLAMNGVPRVPALEATYFLPSRGMHVAEGSNVPQGYPLPAVAKRQFNDAPQQLFSLSE